MKTNESIYETKLEEIKEKWKAIVDENMRVIERIYQKKKENRQNNDNTNKSPNP